MQIAMKAEKSLMRRYGLLSLSVLCLAVASPARAYIAYVSNEKGNTVSVIDTDKWGLSESTASGHIDDLCGELAGHP